MSFAEFKPWFPSFVHLCAALYCPAQPSTALDARAQIRGCAGFEVFMDALPCVSCGAEFKLSD